MYVQLKLTDFYINAISEGVEKCAIGSGGKLSPCLPGKDEMVERDIGPCEGWRLAQGWAQVGQNFFHFTQQWLSLSGDW